MTKLKIVPLEKNHDRNNFNCGNKLLDNYIKKLARQDIKRGMSACFVLSDPEFHVLGYYTLSANSIKRDVFPDNISKKLPPAYQYLPTNLLGRLAIDKKFKGQGLREYLLIDALNRCLKNSFEIGSFAVVVDPKDDQAIKFYSKYGFLMLPGSKKMFIPIKTIEKSIL